MAILQPLIRFWNSLSDGMRTALVVAIAGIIAVLVPILHGYYSRMPDLRISDIRPATLESKPVIEVLLSNNSDAIEAISSLHLILSSQTYAGPITTLAGGAVLRTDYEASDARVDPGGKISGCVRQALKSTSKQVHCYPLQGEMTILGLSQWGIQFIWHSQEAVEPRDHLLIAFVIPDTMTIPKEKAPTDIFKHPVLKQYVSEEHRKVVANKFALSRFLNDLGPLYVYAKIVYRQNQSAVKSEQIRFRE